MPVDRMSRDREVAEVSLKAEVKNMREMFEALKIAEVRMRGIIASIPDMIRRFNETDRSADTGLAIDADEVILSWNPFGIFGRIDEKITVSLWRIEGLMEKISENEIEKLRARLQDYLSEQLDGEEGQISVVISRGCKFERPEDKKMKQGDSKSHCACKDQSI